MARRIVNIHQAKTHLSDLIARAVAGEEVVIAKANKPIVRLIPVEPPKKKKRVFGLNAGGISWIAPDFDAPLAAEFWDGSPTDPLNVWITEQNRRKSGPAARAPVESKPRTKSKVNVAKAKGKRVGGGTR